MAKRKREDTPASGSPPRTGGPGSDLAVYYPTNSTSNDSTSISPLSLSHHSPSGSAHSSITPRFQSFSFTADDKPSSPVLPPNPPNSPSMAHRPPSRPPPASLSHVRRNLFHQNLSRRPTSATSNSTSATTQLLDSPPIDSTSSEIVERDENGNYVIQLPMLPPEEIEEGQEGQEGTGAQAEDVRGWDPKARKRGAGGGPTDTDKGLQWASVQLHLQEIEKDRIRKETDPAGEWECMVGITL